ncbi:hypothetical protein BD410DRAFT_839034 [Rickenella mellea]|uniref:F-box domain-containing protein n=1 Tax=Rickenella mellea TaxID=50990 RepID=A0A4Y7Q7E5_9AGAM|nr:hypothetical protein BD410DRAFT_839034 [Rickenella mellea]
MMLLCSPVEVLAQMIEKLDLRSILRCRQVNVFQSHSELLTVANLLVKSKVCKLLLRVVDSSISIQYAIELFASGVLDNASSTTLNKAQRLTTLRKLNTAWKYLHLPSNSVKIPNKNLTTAYEVSGGLFIQ